MAQDLVMRIIMQASDKASAAMQKVRSASNSLFGSLNELEQELNDVAAAQKMLEQRNALQHTIRRTSRSFLEARQAAKVLREEIAKSGVPTRKQAQELERLARLGDRLKHSQNQQSQQLDRLNHALLQYGIAARDSAQAQAQLDARHDKATQAIERQRAAQERLARAKAAANRMGDMSMQAAAVGHVSRTIAHTAAHGAQHSISAAMSEEDAMQGIIRQVGGLKHADGTLNHAEIAKMRQEIQALSATLPMSTVEIMRMYAAGAKMNVPREELAGYVSEAVKAANAFEAADAGLLAEELGRVRANFNLSRQAASELVNVMNYLDDNALVSGDQLIAYMNEVSGSMGLARIGEKHVAALGSTLISAGTDAGTASKAVGSLFTRLATAPDTKPVRDALEAIGLDAHAVQKGMVTDAQATLEQIVAAVRKMPTEQQAGILKGLAGGEYNRVFASLITNTEAWREQIQLATSSEALGSLDREFAVRVDAMSSKWQMFKNKFFNTESGVGRELFGLVNWGLDVFGGLMDKYNTWAAKNPELAAGLVRTAAVIGLVVAVIAVLALAVSAVLVPLASLRVGLLMLQAGLSGGLGVLPKLAAAWRMLGTTFAFVSRLFMANPIVFAVVAIIGVLYLLWRHWDAVKAAVAAGWAYIRTALRNNPFLAALGGPIGLILAMIANWDRLKAVVVSAWGGIRAVLRDNPIAAALAGPIGLVGALIANFDRLLAKAQQVRSALANLNVGQAASGAWSRVRGMVGFSRGGYTGAGGVNEVAGLVHRGEVVFSQRDVARFGGWQAVEALRRGGRMDEAGMPAMSGAMPARSASASRSSGGLNVGGSNVVIHVHAAPNMDVRQLADVVMHKLQQQQQRQQVRAGSRFWDKD